MGKLEWVEHRSATFRFVVAAMVWENLLNVSRLSQGRRGKPPQNGNAKNKKKRRKVFVRKCSRLLLRSHNN
jgi:hypothetical protein